MAGSPHASTPDEVHPAAEIIERLRGLSGVTCHSSLSFERYVETLQGARASMNLAGFSRERQFALPARAITSLAAGVPTISPPFEDGIHVVAQNRLGALFHPGDDPPEKLVRLLEDDAVAGDAARCAVRSFAHNHIAPPRAIRPLLPHLQGKG